MTAANLFALSPFIRFDPFQDPNKNSTMTETRFPRVLNVFLSFKFCLGQWGVQWVGMPLLCNRWPSIRFHPAIHLSFRKWQLKGREIKQRKILLDTILQHQPLWKHCVMGTSQGVSLKGQSGTHGSKRPKHPESRWPRMTQWGSNGSYDQMWPRWHRNFSYFQYILQISLSHDSEQVFFTLTLLMHLTTFIFSCQWAGYLHPHTLNSSYNFQFLISVSRLSSPSHFKFILQLSLSHVSEQVFFTLTL